MRRPSALAACLATCAAIPALAPAATEDAVIGAMAVSSPTGNGQGYEATVQCPAGERAIGGGILAGAAVSEDIDLRASGPLDESGSMVETKDGDRPVMWYAAGSNFSGSAKEFRVYAVCADANVRVETSRFEMPVGDGAGRSVGCGGGRRAVGGGVIQNGSSGGSFVRESGPTDATASFSKTKDGDIPKRWRATMHNQGGSTFFKVFAVCAEQSNARIEVVSAKLPERTVNRQRDVDCPGNRTALSGGLLHNKGLDGYFGLTMSGPLDETGDFSQTGVGDVPAAWRAGIESIFGGPAARFKAVAICE